MLPAEQTSIADWPDCVYHYCSAEALHGIITSRCFWLSDLCCVNDYKEGAWFAELFAERINKCGDLRETERNDLLGCTKFLPRCYGLSCSEDGDCLSQWRAYAADGTGFAVGIDPRAFKGEPCGTQVTVARIVYDKEEQEGWVDDILRRYLAARDGHVGLPVTHKESWVAQEIGERAFACKNPAFREEREWRLVCRGQLELEPIADAVRVAGNNLVPYFKLGFPKDHGGRGCGIVKIVFGPKNDVERNLEPLWRLLYLSGFDPRGIEYLHSKASLR